MVDVLDRVVVPTWRAFKVAPISIVIMGRHRESVPGVSLVERDLVPALGVFVSAATALRMFDATWVVSLGRQEQNRRELRRRTRFWLTYVRMDLPGYAASEMDGSSDAADVTIDRARGLLDLADKYATGEPPHYMAQMLAEMGPLHERSVRDRADEFDRGLERQTLQREMRRALVPVSEGLVTLRLLLRNALGSTHADVRAIDIDPPSRRKKIEARVMAQAAPSITAPSTAQRMAIGQA
jgi:hypothetical protein